MSTSKETVAFLLAQLEPLDVRARAMFGEYGVYCDEKFVALVCDDTFFPKPTDAADGYSADLTPGPAYLGSNDYLAVDAERFRALVKATAEALPVPKPKKPRASKPGRLR